MSSRPCDLPSSVQPHFWLCPPRCFLVPELHAGEVAFPTGEIEYGARPVRTDPHSKRIGACGVVPVLDHNAIELDRGAPDTELKCPVSLLTVTIDLVVIDPPLDFLCAEEFPRGTLGGDGNGRPKDQQRKDDRRESRRGHELQKASHVDSLFTVAESVDRKRLVRRRWSIGIRGPRRDWRVSLEALLELRHDLHHRSADPGIRRHRALHELNGAGDDLLVDLAALFEVVHSELAARLALAALHDVH